MAEERKEKKFHECLECKHEQATGHHHTTGHTCIAQHKPGHLNDENVDPHQKKKY